MSVGKNITWEKKESVSSIIFPIILKLLGRISSGKGDGHFGEENQVVANFIHPWFKENYVFVSVMNNTEFNVSISPGTILGSCQSHHVKDGEVSQHFIQEPPDRQLDIHNIPVYVKRKDFSRYEENHVCGFAELGSSDMNYKYCLVKIQLLPELRNKFMLLKDEITVQVGVNKAPLGGGGVCQVC